MTNSAGSKLGRRISGIVLAIFTLIWMFPLVWMFFMSFKTNSEIYCRFRSTLIWIISPVRLRL